MPQRIADAAAVTSLSGTGVAIVSAVQPEFLGLTLVQWQIAGIVGGLLVAVAGAALNLALNFYFKRKHLELEMQKAGLSD
ncbi:hypothetical protein WG922_21655 [Ramlibacter sp. AN1015]|uniref:hypothetical protein n=1 Tax=Ramlibacter sp. AN1015 TaxID=3133428 RepID=UPI0030BFBAEB